MAKYDVTGMSCAACSSHVRKSVLKVDGVTDCTVSLLTNSMEVSGEADPAAVIAAVRKAGYDAKKYGEAGVKSASDENETARLVKRLVSSAVFLAALMYISMGHTMLGLPLPSFFEGNCIGLAIAQLLLTVAVMVINSAFFVNGFKSVCHFAPNMDTLVAMGSGAAFVYSTYSLFAMTASKTPEIYMHELYFESAAMILTLITIGKMLEARSKGKTTDAIKGLMELSPETAIIYENGTEREIPVNELKTNDIFIVLPGSRVPVDGTIVEGSAALDESALTGESMPVDKAEGDSVRAASMNLSGHIRCRAERVGEDTTLSRMIRTVSDAAAGKAPVARTADKVSGVFVPVVIAIAIITVIIWLAVGRPFGFALARGISVLVISCPCALGLATPVAIMVASGVGAKHGILFKTAQAIENTGKIKYAVFDKTGTLTEGKPKLTDIVPCKGYDKSELLKLAYSLEKKSEHPLAGAINQYAEENEAELYASDNFIVSAGGGISAVINGCEALGGNVRFVSENTDIPQQVKALVSDLAEKGKTPLIFAYDRKVVGVIAVADTVKNDSKKAVGELRGMGVDVIMLTGDNVKTANAIAAQLGVGEVIAEVLPGDKASEIRKLRSRGRVMMVGDGINDAPALTESDTGIAIGSGVDIAADAADAVLMKHSLLGIPSAVRLSRAALKNIYENLFWAFIYNIIGIPVAAGVFIPAFGLQMNPMIGAAAMSLSSFCVVTNALRLNTIDITSPKRDKKIRHKEVKTMTKTIGIEGMMCPHCSSSVKNALEAIGTVVSADVSHENGTAIVTLSAETADGILKKAVEDKGYKVNTIA